jgi:hypothetical protein
MMKTNNILLLGLVGFGAYYLYKISQKKPIEDISNKESEEQEEATESGGSMGGGFGVPTESTGVGIVKDGVTTPTGDVINITVENKDDEPKLEVKAVDPTKIGGADKLDSATLLANLEKMQTKGGATTLPTTSMGAKPTDGGMPTGGSTKTLVNPKLTTVKGVNATSDLKELKIGALPMSNFLDFDGGDELDENEFIID